MPLDAWILLWKAVLVIGIAMFAILAVVVTIGGARDAAKLLHALREAESDDPTVSANS